MANPRQRRKARSSSHKPVSHSRHAKRNLKKIPPIRGPKVLQDAWDNRKTVRQNYAALGLVHKLDLLASGGTEPLETREQHEDTQVVQGSIPKGFGKIIRDEAGKVLRIEMGEEQQEPETTVLEQWVTNLGGGEKNKGKTIIPGILKELEGIATPMVSRERHSSTGEIKYLTRLVSKYGEDIEGMAKDGRLNPEQRSVGSLRRALKRAGIEGDGLRS